MSAIEWITTLKQRSWEGKSRMMAVLTVLVQNDITGFILVILFVLTAIGEELNLFDDINDD